MDQENGTMRAPANSDPRLSAVGNEPLTALERIPYDPGVAYIGDTLGHTGRTAPPLRGRAEELVFGEDDRTEVQQPVFPFNCIAHLDCQWANGAIGPGTGFFISPTCLITAGHCISPKRATWVKKVTVIPGMTRGTTGRSSKPFGQAIATRFRSVEGWFLDRNDDYDYGAVILPDASLFNRVGAHLGFEAFTAGTHARIEVAGYPKDRSFHFVFAQGDVLRVIGERLAHNADTEAGQSGAPVYDPGSHRVIGVHTGGNPAAQYNTAVKLRAEVAKHWYDWSTLAGT